MTETRQMYYMKAFLKMALCTLFGYGAYLAFNAGAGIMGGSGAFLMLTATNMLSEAISMKSNNAERVR